MKDLINRLRTTRLGFLIILLILLWAKTEFAYYVDFTLGTSGLLQQIIQLINPLGLSALFLSLALYVKKSAARLHHCNCDLSLNDCFGVCQRVVLPRVH